MAEENKKVEEPKVEKTDKKEKVTKVKMQKVEQKITKVNLDTPKQENKEVEKPVEEDIVVVNPEPKEEVKVEDKKEETPIVQEVTNEEPIEETKSSFKEVPVETPKNPLPEKLQKVVEFMNETGGDLNDYVSLNRDISKLDDSEVLDEYYRATKSHLSPEERNFILEERYGYDADVDEPNDIKKKKIALKEQVAEARAHLDRQKSKYYEDIKAGSKLTDEQQKAVDFFNRYNKEERERLAEESKKSFKQKTESVFNENFKGFDYKVGDKKFRFNVKDANKVKETQSDLNNFINKFVGEDNSTINDPQGYHKSLFTAMNADTIAKHFYEQGRADAIKDTVAKDKNIDTSPRQTHGETEVGGVKYKVLGESTTDMKNRSFKIRKKN